MYCRFTRGHFDPAKIDDLTRLLPGVNAAVAQLPGYHSSHLAIDRDTGQTVSMTVFDTLEQAQFSSATLGESYKSLKTVWQGEPAEFYEMVP